MIAEDTCTYFRSQLHNKYFILLTPVDKLESEEIWWRFYMAHFNSLVKCV